MTEFIKALFLGFIEGLTEFIPVSSTGHLVLVADWIGFYSPGHVFEVFIQLGAIMAVIVFFREKIFDTFIGLPHERTAQKFTLNLVLVTIPALAAGLLAHGMIKHMYTPEVIGASLVIGGIVILLMERRVTRSAVKSVDEISWRTALMIGIVQTLALIPGVSRSGATIMGGLAFGLDRKTAAEFSFFAAIPVMFAATLYDLYSNLDKFTGGSEFVMLGVGFVSAFVTALAVLKFALDIISRYGFAPFAWYRIVAGGLILAFSFVF
jgi:undecaprenyl-diphosphatase